MSVRPLLAVAVALVFLGTGGCGDDRRSGVAPAAWVRSVCTALSPWRAEISELTTKAQQQLKTAKTAAQTKTNVVELLSGAANASERARAGVSGAGVPDVEDGETVAKYFAMSLERARDAYGNAKSTIDALPTNDAEKFYEGVTQAFAKLKEEYAASELDPSHVQSKELRRAFDEVPECR